MPQQPEIAAFVAQVTAFQDAQDKSIDGLVADVDELNAEITKLQNTPPVLDPADQALLDGITTRGQAIAAKLDALDQKTPPAAPAA